MGDVYLAVDTSLDDREVAFKVLRDTSQQNYQERFFREATTAAKLQHAHIVPVYDYNIEDGVHYIVMRLMTGGTLESHLNSHYLSLDATDQLLKQLAAALEYAHRRGVVHRDIKPSNTLFDDDNSAYLADFGIAKLIDVTSGQTSGSTLWGTWPYMAPELWRSEPASTATDIYALGVLVYKTLTGNAPFEATSPYGFMMQHLYENAPPPQVSRPDLPKAIQYVLETAMAKEAQQRFTHARAFSEAFEQAISRPASRLKTTPMVVPISSRPAERVMSSDEPTTTMPQTAPRGAGRIQVVIGLVIVLLAALVVFTLNAPPVPSLTAVPTANTGISILPTPTTAPATAVPTATPLFTATHALTATPTLTQPASATFPPVPTRAVVMAFSGPVTPASQMANGELTESVKAATWNYGWQAGEVYSICARSRDFDVVLSVQTPGGLVISSDDTRGTTDACIMNFIVSAAGSHTVMVNSFDRQSTGSYSLEILSYNDCSPALPIGRVSIGSEATLRAWPTTFSDPAGVLPVNECFAIVGRDGRDAWWKIQTPDGQVGWIANSLIEVIGSVEGVPLASE